MVREYVGGGPVGELAAAEDAARRDRAATERAALLADRERTAGPEALLVALDAAADALASAALVVAGYRRHHRGAWRKRRGKPQGE